MSPPEVPRRLSFLDEEASRLESLGLLRTARVFEPAPGTRIFCSNDYLGFGALPLPSAAFGVASGSGASPLVVGYHAAHLEAEQALATWLEREAALLFTSGYAANLGTIAALVGPGDVVFSDALNHASIIDGCRLSGAKVIVYPHLDMDRLAVVSRMHEAARRRLIVTESYFSMDADSPDLARLASIAAESESIWMVDEAHALGVLGPGGRGLCRERGLSPDILVGTLGKALGLQGAFVTGSHSLRLFLWNRARSLVFSTGLSPAVASSVRQRVAMVMAADAERESVVRASSRLRLGLVGHGWDVRGEGHVVPVVVGSASVAAGLSAHLRERGVIVQAIRPPTVPESTSRLRITVSAGVSASDVDEVLDAFAGFAHGR